MDINSVFPSKYLKASDLQGQDATVTISHVAIEDVGGDDRKPVVYFTGKDKGIVLNKTNAAAIQNLYGADTDNWTGKRIILFPTQTDFQGKPTACIRVRLNAPPAEPAPAQAEAPAADTGKIPF